MKLWSEEKNAPEPGRFLCNEDEIPAADVKELILAADSKQPFRIILHRIGGNVRCFMNKCPHFSIPLNVHPGQFFGSDRSKLMCATHYAVFDLDSGFCSDGPCMGSSLEAIPVELSDGVVRVGSNVASK
jgi:nitrite reductase/ring-hydroxylating ferredoxin subunit